MWFSDTKRKQGSKERLHAVAGSTPSPLFDLRRLVDAPLLIIAYKSQWGGNGIEWIYSDLRAPTTKYLVINSSVRDYINTK